VTDEDLATILQLAAAPDLVPATRYPTADEHAEPLIAVRERASVLVAAFQRDASFRHQVLGAYEHRCAVSGLGLGAISTTKTRGILDAAHIRPVQSGGPDAVSNGLPLTPTLHRLFDAGLFTLRYEDDHPVVRVSQNLDREVIEVPERGFSLPLRDGLRLLTPKGREQFPNRHQLEFHERHVFLG
jgi:putative restriction endonuclease